MRMGVHSGVDYSARGGLQCDKERRSPIRRAGTIGRHEQEPRAIIADNVLGGGVQARGYRVQFPIVLLSATLRHSKAHFYSEHGRW